VRELVLHPRRSWSIPCGESDVVSEVLPGSVAEDKGLRRGAVIESLSTDIAGRDPAVVVWYHAGRKFGPYALPRLPDGPSVTFGLPRNTENLRIGRLDEALAAGWGETRETVLQTSVLLKKIVGRRTTPEIMMGPLGIAQAAYTLAGKGLGHMLWLLGVIGISLAMINLLPIPVLDGGHLAFLCYEAVFRRQPSQRVMEVAQYAGLLIILALFGFAFWNDISRTFGIGGG
jgi:membrane-associated protease RseP (regulator of RpoE activity)